MITKEMNFVFGIFLNELEKDFRLCFIKEKDNTTMKRTDVKENNNS
jgi:hypothetical protein